MDMEKFRVFAYVAVILAILAYYFVLPLTATKTEVQVLTTISSSGHQGTSYSAAAIINGNEAHVSINSKKTYDLLTAAPNSNFTLDCYEIPVFGWHCN